MQTIDLLSSSLGQKGNEANIQLAKKIAETNHKDAINELITNLNHKNKNIQSDCIKTLYETGYIKPELIANYLTDFIKLLNNKNNRLVWGAMIAIATITDLKHKEIFAALDKVMDTIKKGSVITIDAGVLILANLNQHKEYFNTTDSLLIEQLWKCPIKQLPMYIEKTMISICKENKEIYSTIIEKRKTECENDSQKKRLEKSFKQINTI